MLFSGIDSDSNLRVRIIYYTELVFFYKKLSEVSCSDVNSAFVIDVFKGYKKGVDYFSSYLEIERKWIIFADVSSHPYQEDLVLMLMSIFQKEKKLHMSLTKLSFAE